jgi:hypothetical protein
VETYGEWSTFKWGLVIILPHKPSYVNSGNLNSYTKPHFLGILQTTKPPYWAYKNIEKLYGFWIKPHINLYKLYGFISKDNGLLLCIILGGILSLLNTLALWAAAPLPKIQGYLKDDRNTKPPSMIYKPYIPDIKPL